MGSNSTLFAATEEELFVLLPDWLVPRDKPIEKKRLNRFTPRAMLRPSWVPDEGTAATVPPAAAKKQLGPIIPSVIPPEGEFADYEASLEERAPKRLRTVPHACLRNVSGDHLASLATLLRIPPDPRPVRVLPSGEVVDRLADGATRQIATLSDGALSRLAGKWAQDSKVAFPSADEALWVLRRVQALARLSAGTERRICVFVEP